VRVAFLVSFFPNLSETFILDQVTGLIDRGCDVDIYADLPVNDTVAHPEVDTYLLQERIHELPIPAGYHRRLFTASALVLANLTKYPQMQLRSLNVFKYGQRAISLRLFYETVACMSRKPYDILHCHFGPNGLRGLMLREVGALQGRLITSFHGYDVSSYVRRAGARRYHRLFQKGDLFLAVSDNIERRLIELGCAADRILVHRLGVDLHKFDTASRRHRSNDLINIVTIARLVQKKGIEYGIRAIARLVEAGLRVNYTIVGDGPLRDSLQNLIRVAGLNTVVQLAGPKRRPEIADLLAKTDILLAPSVTADNGDQEGSPVVLMEALAAGIPVVSTQHSGIPEVVEDGVTGFLVPERDVVRLADRLQYLIEHPHARYRMGQAGRAVVKREFDIEKSNDRLLEIYNGLVPEPAPSVDSRHSIDRRAITRHSTPQIHLLPPR
jgi:colanic acid/amylovoran biosynthesis glycosyltransferase